MKYNIMDKHKENITLSEEKRELARDLKNAFGLVSPFIVKG